MAIVEPRGVSDAAASGLDVRTAIEIGERGLFDRMAFAAVFAVIGIAVLPAFACIAWIASIAAWEWGIGPRLDRLVLRLPDERARLPYAAMNLPPAALYHALALMCLVNGSPLGVAVGVTWMTGAILNNFVYASAYRPLLLATMVPAALYSFLGPFLAYGWDWRSLAVPLLIGLSALASQRFSVDHRAVVSQLAERQLALDAVERKLSVAIEASGDGLFEVDLIAETMTVSPNWLGMLGYAPDEFDGGARSWRRFVHPDDVERVMERNAAHYRGEAPFAGSEIRMLCKDGSLKWVLWRSRLVAHTDAGVPWRMVGTTIDISERKALEHALESARDQAEAASRAKSEFLANMSHEIRTPLNGVMGVASALRRADLDERQAEMVSVIEDSAESLQVLLADVLDLARVEAGRLEIAPEPFDLIGAVESLAALFRAKAEEKGLTLNVAVAGDVARWVLGDKVRIKQIVGNLLSNAVKFTAAGSVSLSLARAEGDRVCFVVKDDGIGFGEQTQARLFSRFEQADGSITRRFGGAGLGLSISQALAELMGGTIDAHSKPGHGATFLLTLPLPAAEPPAVNAAPALPAVALGHDAPLRILAAEDHEVNRRVLKLMFDGLSVEMAMAENGREAVERFAQADYDLVLMDMQMPEMDGLQATAAIREMEQKKRLPRTPIIMLTANALPEHQAAGRAAGADAFVTKPVSAQALLETIDATITALMRARDAERGEAARSAS